MGLNGSTNTQEVEPTPHTMINPRTGQNSERSNLGNQGGAHIPCRRRDNTLATLFALTYHLILSPLFRFHDVNPSPPPSRPCSGTARVAAAGSPPT